MILNDQGALCCPSQIAGPVKEECLMAGLMVKIFRSLQQGPGFLILLVLLAVACFVGYEILYALVG